MRNKNNLRQKSNLTKIGDLLPHVKELLGLEKSLNIMALKELWPLIISFDISKYSEPSYFDKNNNLVVAVKSGSLAANLSMQKVQILNKLKQATKDSNITFKEIRFIVK